MMVVIGSLKEAPGVTTLAVAVAARSPAPGTAVVVEADPAGGDLQARYGMPGEPGLSDLAADTATGGRHVDLAAYARRVDPLGVSVVFGPADEYHGRTATDPADGSWLGESTLAVGMLAGAGLPRLLRAAEHRLVVLDVGRLDWASPALPLAAAADVFLLLTRASTEGLDAVRVRRNRLLALPGLHASVRLVLRGRPPYPVRDIATATGLPVAALIPDDHRGAAVLSGRARPGPGWTRTELLRAARALATSLAPHAPPPAPAEPPPVPAGPPPAPPAVRVARFLPPGQVKP
jgi:hypothetical protein